MPHLLWTSPVERSMLHSFPSLGTHVSHHSQYVMWEVLPNSSTSHRSWFHTLSCLLQAWRRQDILWLKFSFWLCWEIWCVPGFPGKCICESTDSGLATCRGCSCAIHSCRAARHGPWELLAGRRSCRAEVPHSHGEACPALSGLRGWLEPTAPRGVWVNLWDGHLWPLSTGTALCTKAPRLCAIQRLISPCSCQRSPWQLTDQCVIKGHLLLNSQRSIVRMNCPSVISLTHFPGTVRDWELALVFG